MSAPRLHLDLADPPRPGRLTTLDDEGRRYLLQVLRLRRGDELIVFDGVHGDWAATIESAGRKTCRVRLENRLRPQDVNPDVTAAFAPPKGPRLDDLAARLTELGAGTLQPTLTERGSVRKLRPERLRARSVAAAMQCGFNGLPKIEPLTPLPDLIAAWRGVRRLLFCDETAAGDDDAAPSTIVPTSLDDPASSSPRPMPWAILIGPEGGFSETERRLIAAAEPAPLRLHLGPRILRIETAAAAALALWQSAHGDWRRRERS